MVLKAQTMVRIQKIQRQPRYWTIRPPKRGPRVGPRRGPRRYQPKMPLGWVRGEGLPRGTGGWEEDLRSLAGVEHVAYCSAAICYTHAWEFLVYSPIDRSGGNC